MNEATCAALTAVFPLIMLAIVAERRYVAMKVRRLRLFRAAQLTTLGLSLGGTATALLGVNLGGYSPLPGFGVWAITFVALAGLGFTLIAAIATAEVEEDDASTTDGA